MGVIDRREVGHRLRVYRELLASEIGSRSPLGTSSLSAAPSAVWRPEWNYGSRFDDDPLADPSS